MANSWAMICFCFISTILIAGTAHGFRKDGSTFPATSSLGINYGRVADNLPKPSKAVEIMQKLNAGYVKIYDADHRVLEALSHAGIQVVITVKNEDIPMIASNPASADKWVKTNVLRYYPSTAICMIMVGNEILSHSNGSQLGSQLVTAMSNMYASLAKHRLDGVIKVTTSVAMDCLASSYPPSSGAFREDIAESVMKPMLQILYQTDSYFFLNVYPYFAWSSDPTHISLDYAMFDLHNAVIRDGPLNYSNLLDAQSDAVLAAMAKLGYSQVKLAISETGWPSKGDASQLGANVSNAARYNTGLVTKTLAGGTPRRPGVFIPTFIFSLFNEDQKPGPTTERNWGLFYPNGRPVYKIDLSSAAGTTENCPPPAPELYEGPAAMWCLAHRLADRSSLQAALNYACAAGADCSAIEPGQNCFQPNTLIAHASYAFNSYWQNTKTIGGTCDFQGDAVLTTTDPSYPGCSYPSSM